MRFPLAAASVCCLTFASGHALADCKSEVADAFAKQRSSPVFRIEMEQPTAEGTVKIRVDYMPPTKMLQTVTGPNLPGEQQTMLVGDRAFAGTDGAYEELLPQFAQSIAAEFKATVGPIANVGDFECLGKTAYEGKDFVAYRTKESTDTSNGLDGITRTVYVDPASGLPAFNVVAKKTEAVPVMRAAYSYPTGVTIEAPEGAPIQKTK
jgi:hypothetical protein